jgi:hypothetical protein
VERRAMDVVLSLREESRMMNMTREDYSRPSQRSKHLMTDKMSKQPRFVMIPMAEYVMNKTRTDCSRPSQKSRHLMTDKMSKQPRFVMIPMAEYVMSKTRTDCSRLSQWYRQLMTAQPDPRDWSSQHQDVAIMTTVPVTTSRKTTAQMTPTPTV